MLEDVMSIVFWVKLVIQFWITAYLWIHCECCWWFCWHWSAYIKLLPQCIFGGPKWEKCPTETAPKCNAFQLSEQTGKGHWAGQSNRCLLPCSDLRVILICSLCEEDVLMDWRCCLREWKKRKKEGEKNRPNEHERWRKKQMWWWRWLPVCFPDSA